MTAHVWSRKRRHTEVQSRRSGTHKQSETIMFVAVVSNVYQLYLILTNRENTSCVDKYILRVASVVRCVAAQYRVHIMTSSFFKQTQCC